MDWGYYCRTCGESSPKLYPDPESPREAAATMADTVFRMVMDQPDAPKPPVCLAAVEFLARHTGHDLWTECPSGVFRLSPGVEPVGQVSPPQFAHSMSSSSSR